MRNVLLFSLLIAFATAAHAGDKNKPVDLTGSWKETERMAKDRSAVPFTDTIRIDFQVGNEFLWQKAGSFMFKGTYKATATSLDLGARYFTVIESASGRMLLQDENGYYRLTKYKKPAEVENNNAATSAGRSNNEITGDVVVSSFNGNWETYKRTSKVQQQAIDYQRIPKRILLKVKDKQVSGELHAAQEVFGKVDWRLDKYEQDYLFFSGKDARKLRVLKCDGKEMILEEGNFTYFLKKFN